MELRGVSRRNSKGFRINDETTRQVKGTAGRIGRNNRSGQTGQRRVDPRRVHLSGTSHANLYSRMRLV